ncbi:MAG: ABC transporter ATP-binding protein [Anaerolineaceae bacterium]|nr:ABC transporter ATP-binding protein [Anaerolineaceae bacterium]
MTFQDSHGGLEVLRDISFSLRGDEFVCVLGPSGSGKSTLLRLIGGLLDASRGSIMFGGENPLRVGLVFQHANLMPWRTVRQNISLPLELLGRAAEEVDRRVDEMMRLVGLEDFGSSWPSQLSGGMAQRVAIARAYIQEPDLLLLDEPFGALDALTRDRMGSELLRIWQRQRTPVIMVTHSISEALLLSDRILLLSPRPGQIVKDMPVTFTRPRREELRYTAEFQQLERSLRGSLQQNFS